MLLCSDKGMGFEPFPSCLSCLVRRSVPKRTRLVSGTRAVGVLQQGVFGCSVQPAVPTPGAVTALSHFASTRPPRLPLCLCPRSFSIVPASPHFLLPEALYPFHFPLPEHFSLPPSVVTRSCHLPSSLPIRICSAGDQSQRDVFPSTAAITQNSISPNWK